MKALEERIIKEGIVLPGDVLKVGSFLNHKIDTVLLSQMASEAAELFKNEEITKIVTVEASGIALATAIGIKIGVPVVFAKKNMTSNVSGQVYSAKVHSYTHNRDNVIIIPKDYLNSDDKFLIVDDFLASGEAIEGLISIINDCGGKISGCLAAVEKGFQGGGDALRSRGIKVESLALIESMDKNGEIKFRK